MKRYLAGLCFLTLAVVVAPSMVRAETATTNVSVTSSLSMLESLMKQVEALQKQLAALRGEIQQVREDLRDGLKEGVENDDVKKIQELLATDPTIYPKGLISGFYGPLTADAVRAFQKRHDLTVTGEVDAKTKALMLEYFKEKTGGKIPAGLLKAPGIDKKIKDRLVKGDDKEWSLDCHDKKAAGPLCKDHDHDDHDHDEHEHEDEDEDDDKEDSRDKVVAQRAMDEAEDTIADLEGAIDSAEDDDFIDDAEEELDEAEEYLVKAENYFADGSYTFAYRNAVKARQTAEKALDRLVNLDDPAAEASAEGMIDAAADAITDLEDAIADASDDDARADAEDELEEAEEYLAKAEVDFDKEEFRRSYDRALEAKQIALKALADLEDAE